MFPHPRAFPGLPTMASIFWFSVLVDNIDDGYGPGLPFMAWVTDDYGQDDLLPVLHGPQEPPFTSTDECPF